MRIFICTSKYLYDKVPTIKEQLEASGHKLTLPNNYDNPFLENKLREKSKDECNEWKAGMFRLQEEKIEANDAILVLNYEKHGQENYIGGATFLEIFQAFQLERKIYLMNPIPEGMLRDEIEAMQPIILNGDLTKIQYLEDI